MPKPPSPSNELSKESSPIAPSNHASPQPHSPPIIDPYVDVVLKANQNHNKTQPQLPPSLTREILIDDTNQLQDLSNLLAMHLSNHTTNPTPSTPILPLRFLGAYGCILDYITSDLEDDRSSSLALKERRKG
ncbi:hypothetical protein Tco_0386655 [Tanacetum coccineum]